MIKPFVGWGDGPDVGINLKRTSSEAALWGPVFWPLDFTASEARQLAAELVACAEAAEKLDKELAAYEAGGD